MRTFFSKIGALNHKLLVVVSRRLRLSFVRAMPLCTLSIAINSFSQSSKYAGSGGHSRVKQNLALSSVLNFGLKFPVGPQVNLNSLTLPTAMATSGLQLDLSIATWPTCAWVHPTFLRNVIDAAYTCSFRKLSW